MIRVLHAEEQDLIREGFKCFIQSIFPLYTIDNASDPSQILNMSLNNQYDLVVLDINLSESNPFELVRQLIAKKPLLKILILSEKEEQVLAKKLLQAGVKGFLSKSSSSAEIKKGIRDVLDNKIYLSESLTQAITEEALGKKSANSLTSLSPREYEIMLLLIQGVALSYISSKLNLHASTIGTHKARIFRKLNVNNIIELNRLVLKQKGNLYNSLPV
jgi:DNA-binding NarL/FixJ family response regulator